MLLVSEMEENIRKCAFCGSENPPYTCPRCQQPYCKLTCYRHVDHQECTETFYKEWVKTCLSGTSTGTEGKTKMLEILKRLHHEQQQMVPLDSDDDESDCNSSDGDKDLQDLNDRLLSQLEISSPDDLWNNLNTSDKEAVKTVLDDQEILLWKPWWHHKEFARKLVSEIDQVEEESSSPVPRIPDNIPGLHTLTSRTPSDSIEFQLLNLLAAYTFTARYFNGDHLDEPEDSLQMLFQRSEALRNNLHVSSAVESIYKLRDDHQQDPPIDNRALCLVFDDICEILKGPVVDNNCHYVCAALSDILEIMKKAKLQEHLNTKKKEVKLAIKKVEYLRSWNQDYGLKILKKNIPVLQYEIASLAENTNSLEEVQRNLAAQSGHESKIVEI